MKRKKRAGVGGVEIHHLAAGAASAQIAEQRGVAPDLGGEAEAADLARAPRHLEVEAAQRLAVEADHGAELHVEVDIRRRGAWRTDPAMRRRPST